VTTLAPREGPRRVGDELVETRPNQAHDDSDMKDSDSLRPPLQPGEFDWKYQLHQADINPWYSNKAFEMVGLATS
jgi:hypothetical protein